MAHNGMLATVYFRLQAERSQLSELVESQPGGREAALQDAAENQASLKALEAASPAGTPGATTPVAFAGTSQAGAGSPRSGTPDPDHGGHLRRRSIGANLRVNKKKGRIAEESLPRPDPDLPHGTSLEPAHEITPHSTQQPSPLAWSTNEKIAILARNIDAMQEELKSNGAKGLVWPQNVTYSHFLDYLFIPTLVYQLEYPRTST